MLDVRLDFLLSYECPVLIFVINWFLCIIFLFVFYPRSFMKLGVLFSLPLFLVPRWYFEFNRHISVWWINRWTVLLNIHQRAPDILVDSFIKKKKKFTGRSQLAKDRLSIRNIISYHLISWNLGTVTIEEALANINKNYDSESAFMHRGKHTVSSYLSAKCCSLRWGTESTVFIY